MSVIPGYKQAASFQETIASTKEERKPGMALASVRTASSELDWTLIKS